MEVQCTVNSWSSVHADERSLEVRVALALECTLFRSEKRDINELQHGSTSVSLVSLVDRSCCMHVQSFREMFCDP